MSLTQYMLSGKLITVEIPDNHKDLLIRRERLKEERVALNKRLTQSTNHIQRSNLGLEIRKIKSELSIINVRLHRFAVQKKEQKTKSENRLKTKIKCKLEKRQKELEKKGFQVFPESQDWEAKYKWSIALLDKAMTLLHNKNTTDLSNERLLELLDNSFGACTAWGKLQEVEQEIANTYLNKTN